MFLSLKATIEHLDSIYRITATLDRLGITVKQLYKLHDIGQFAIISPYRGELSRNENKRRMTELVQYLNSLGYKWEPSQGTWGTEDSPKGYEIENSLLVYEMPFEEASDLAQYFNQEAIIYKPQAGNVAMFNFTTNEANVMREFEADPTALRPRRKEEIKKEYEERGEGIPPDLEEKLRQDPSTKWRDMELKYEFDWDTPVSFEEALRS